jgi:hypothetical protein
MTEFKLQLAENEAEFIKQVLGELPTKSNAWQVLVKIQGQMDQQKQQEAPPPPA